MNDIPVPSSDSLAHQSDENRLTAEVYEDFHEALDILYIKGNLSGRLKFLESWPDAGQLIFGQELIGFDHDGVSDLERRSALEDEAEERRLELLEIAQTLEEKSVDKSVLQIEYVEALVKKLDRDLALLFYSPKIVNRFIPPPPEPEVVEDASEVEQQEMGAVSNDPLNTDQKDIEALADQIAPEAPQAGAPSASNPVVDAPEPPKKARPQNPAQAAQADLPDPFAEKPAAPEPVVPEIDDNLDAVEPISVEPPPQRAVPEDMQQEAAQQNPALEPVPQAPEEPQAPAEPENVFLGRSPYDRDDQPPPPSEAPASPPSPVSAPSPDPAQHDVTKSAAHTALDDMQPVASQKMTFMPAKNPDDPAQAEKPVVPVIGGEKDKPQDEGL